MRTFRALPLGVLAAVLLAPRASAQCGCPNASFAPAAREFPVRGVPTAMATADFDRDGLADVVVSRNDSAGGGIVLLRGLPQGGFGPPTLLAVHSQSISMFAVDLDGDGKIDVVALTLSDVVVLFGNGDGTFSTPLHVPAGNSPSGLAVADLNHDGLPDLIVAPSSGFVVVLNLGSRAFGAPQNGGVSIQSGLLVVADFDGDGSPDVYLGGFADLLFHGNGDGTFAATPVSNVTGGSSYSAVVGDFDRDGRMDLAIVRSSDLAIFHGRGDGTFSVPVSVDPHGEVGLGSGLLAAVDMNSDGWLDLVAFGSPGFLLRVVLSDGAGGFHPAAEYPVSANVELLAADFDRDGRPDVVVATSDSIALFTGGPSGSLAALPILPGTGIMALASADFNGDGNLDLVAGGAEVTVWIGDGAGHFASGYTITLPTTVRSIAAVDVNDDGAVDIVALLGEPDIFPTSGNLWVFLGDGAGNFTPLPVHHVDYRVLSLAVSKLDGDAFPDLLIGSFPSAGTGPGFHVFRGVGDGSFVATDDIESNVTFDSLVVSDFEKNGAADVAAFASGPGALGAAVLLGHDDLTFAPRTDYSLFGTSFVVGDFNGDGNLDLVSDSHLSILRGKGDGTFEPALAFSSAPSGAYLAAFHANPDSILDLAFLSLFDSNLQVLAGVGDGTFSEIGRYLAASGAREVIAGDWNGDGRTDLAFATNTGVSILMNTSCLPRRLGAVVGPGSCDVPGAFFSLQPSVSVFDDGGNAVCSAGIVSASLVPGTGAPGAILGGTTSVAAVGGTAAFTDLSIDRGGSGFVLEFLLAGAKSVRSRPFSIENPTYSVLASSRACAGSSGNVASVPSVGSGATYAWTIFNGTIDSGAGTASILYTAGASGNVDLQVTATDGLGCPSHGSRSVPIGALCGADFYTTEPCRLVDTRQSDGPALAAGSDRDFILVGRCGVPSDAKALSVNFAVTNTGGSGNLQVYPAGGTLPAAATINFGAGQTRANNGVIRMGLGGAISVHCGQSSGTTDLIIDVNGFYR